MVAIRFLSDWRMSLRTATPSALRATIVAGAATMLVWLQPTVVAAAMAPADDSSDPLKAAAAYYNYLSEHAPGMVDALVDYSEENSKPAKCDRSQKPKVGAVLIGATDAGPPFNKLSGPDNDVKQGN